MHNVRHFVESDRFAERTGVRLVTVAPGRATAEMVLEPFHANGLGDAQGGAIFTLADFAFAAAANSHGTVAVAINVSITFMKAARQGKLRAEAQELSRNHRLGTYTVEVRDEAGELVAVFQGLAYRKQQKIPDAAAIPGSGAVPA